ncbi:uncharacterized protein LOC133907228 [Phragmites australis]|uniref:uncharacterized protein LOC133907228 n=1 Tax=Phragmites australis TaxID=29695 RepID=UPI002D79FD5B|nr:uncharacterized protein LOC133907228 [Phragmites australis]
MGAAGSSSRIEDDNHDIFYRNTSEESEGSDFKFDNQDRPIDMLCLPTTEQAMKKEENSDITYDAKQMEKRRRRAIECIAAWFNEAGIPFNTVGLESFDLMLEAIAQCGPGLRGPSLDKLDELLLQREVLAINDSIEPLKKSWASEGCSILVDTEIDDDGRRMLNLAVHCSQGVSFLRSVQLSSDICDDAFVCQLVDSCIEEVGQQNVVQVITNNNLEMIAVKMLTAKRPNIFWTYCAASCIDMMLEDIGHIPLIKNTIAKARSLTAFIYGHTNLLDMMRQFTNQRDLVHVGITYYTTCCLNLKSLYDKRIEMKTMFISKEWEDSKWSKVPVGKKFYNLVVSSDFWDRVLYVINSFEPLVEVLRRMGSGRPSMGYIYGELANAKREIAFRFENKEEHYLPIWDHIDFRIDHYMKKPLHLAGYYLNPLFYYQNRNDIEKTEIFRDALVECMRNLYQDQPTQEKIVHQLKLYRTASQSFGTTHAIRSQMNLDPVSWWELHGGAAKELSTMALRILRLTCGSLAYEQSWIEMIHKKKPSWVQHKKFEDSMFVTVNRRIQGKAQMRDRDPLLAYLPGEDEPFEWLVGMFRFYAQLPQYRGILMARANSSDVAGLSKLANILLDDAEFMTSEEGCEESDEELPRHSNKKKTSSGASCSKRANWMFWLLNASYMDYDYHDTFGNASKESKENDFKSENQDSEGPIDIPSVPTTEQNVKKREDAQTNAKWMEKRKKRVLE